MTNNEVPNDEGMTKDEVPNDEGMTNEGMTNVEWIRMWRQRGVVDVNDADCGNLNDQDANRGRDPMNRAQRNSAPSSFDIRPSSFPRHWVFRPSSFLNRRLFGQLAVVGLLVACLRLLRLGAGTWHTAAPRVDEKEEFAFRPPGALPEAEFLARCIHCYLCQDVCPVGCIHMQPDAEVDRHTPFIMPRVKGCTLCLKCGEICPTGALRPLASKGEVHMGIAAVDETVCVSHLRTGACGACFTVCPMRGKAITQGLYNAPSVHAEFCTGCGLCEEVCIVPYRAIRVYPNAEIARASAGSVS